MIGSCNQVNLIHSKKRSGRVANVLLSAIKSLGRKNSSEILKDGNISKEFVDRLVQNLEPDLFLERIKMRCSGWNKFLLEIILLQKRK